MSSRRAEPAPAPGGTPPRPALPPRKARPGSDWDRCESCEGRGGYYYENEDDTVRAHWLWTACDDCSAHVQGEDGIWRNWALFADGSCPDGLGWHPPEIGDVHDQAEQRRLVEVRMYGERLIPQ